MRRSISAFFRASKRLDSGVVGHIFILQNGPELTKMCLKDEHGLGLWWTDDGGSQCCTGQPDLGSEGSRQTGHVG